MPRASNTSWPTRASKAGSSAAPKPATAAWCGAECLLAGQALGLTLRSFPRGRQLRGALRGAYLADCFEQLLLADQVAKDDGLVRRVGRVDRQQRNRVAL